MTDGVDSNTSASQLPSSSNGTRSFTLESHFVTPAAVLNRTPLRRGARASPLPPSCTSHCCIRL
eukprot:6015521-Prorocentrum_lima.AAC.1